MKIMVARMPDPYFSDIPELGNLIMDYVILDYDYPLLFVCRDKNYNLYLCDCCDTYKEQRWVIAPISKNSLLAVLTNKLEMRSAFEQATGSCCVAVWSFDDPHEKYTLLSADEFLSEDLPAKGAFLDAEEGEYLDYIKLLTYRISQAPLKEAWMESDDGSLLLEPNCCIDNQLHNINIYESSANLDGGLSKDFQSETCSCPLPGVNACAA